MRAHKKNEERLSRCDAHRRHATKAHNPDQTSHESIISIDKDDDDFERNTSAAMRLLKLCSNTITAQKHQQTVVTYSTAAQHINWRGEGEKGGGAIKPKSTNRQFSNKHTPSVQSNAINQPTIRSIHVCMCEHIDGNNYSRRVYFYL